MLLEAVISEIIERDKLRSRLVRRTYCLPAVREKKSALFDFFSQKVPCGFTEELENPLTLAHPQHTVLHGFFPMCLSLTYGHVIKSCKPKKKTKQKPEDLQANKM